MLFCLLLISFLLLLHSHPTQQRVSSLSESDTFIPCLVNVLLTGIVPLCRCSLPCSQSKPDRVCLSRKAGLQVFRYITCFRLQTVCLLPPHICSPLLGAEDRMPSLSWKTGCEHCFTTLTGTLKEAFDMSQAVKGVLIDPDLPLGLIHGSKKNN